MKIQALYRNDAGQIIAEVLGAGKTVKTFGSSISEVTKRIVKLSVFTDYDEVKQDLALNYSDFK
jgi:hypothetical protein